MFDRRAFDKLVYDISRKVKNDVVEKQLLVALNIIMGETIATDDGLVGGVNVVAGLFGNRNGSFVVLQRGSGMSSGDVDIISRGSDSNSIGRDAATSSGVSGDVLVRSNRMGYNMFTGQNVLGPCGPAVSDRHGPVIKPLSRAAQPLLSGSGVPSAACLASVSDQGHRGQNLSVLVVCMVSLFTMLFVEGIACCSTGNNVPMSTPKVLDTVTRYNDANTGMAMLQAQLQMDGVSWGDIQIPTNDTRFLQVDDINVYTAISIVVALSAVVGLSAKRACRSVSSALCSKNGQQHIPSNDQATAVNFKHQPKDLNASIEQQPQQTKRLPGAQVRSLLGNEP